MWESRNDIFEQIQFRPKCVFLALEKFQLRTFLVKFLYRSIYFNFVFGYLEELQFFPISKEYFFKKQTLISVTLRNGYFLRKKPCYQKTFSLYQENLVFFWLLENRNLLTSVRKYAKTIAASGIWTRNLRLPNRDDTRHMFYTIHQRLWRLVNSARPEQEQFQEKEKKLRLLNWVFSFRKFFFRRKVTRSALQLCDILR